MDKKTEDTLKNKGEFQTNLWGEEVRMDEKAKLFEKFIIPPFSVLDTRQGYWQDRKKAWIRGLSIKSESGRSKTKAMGTYSGSVPGYYDKKAAVERELGIELSNQEFEANYLPQLLANTSLAFTDKGGILSIFDPVMCELMYRWFSPAEGNILDPFAGGSVRGIVANFLGYKYTGIDLNTEQIEENKKQGLEILGKDNVPTWINGNSVNVKEFYKDKEADFVFSCPPYFDLEQYTDDPEDLSNLEWEDFKKEYKQIIKNCCDLLKDNRFACFVVSEVRDRENGYYRNLVGLTTECFLEAGLKLWNEMILLNTCGSVPMRVSQQFNKTRKIGRIHQNILVYYKGTNQEEIRNLTFKKDEND
jgi:DNA modification methylase